MLGAALHRTPASLARAVRDATPATSGVLLQFPFYAGILGIMTGTHLSESIASIFVRASSAALHPAFIACYAAVLGVFVPSGGSKWVIEAPYVLQAASSLGVTDGWAVVTYDLGEALANLVQPFWMCPSSRCSAFAPATSWATNYLVAAVLVPVVLVLVAVLRPAT